MTSSDCTDSSFMELQELRPKPVFYPRNSNNIIMLARVNNIDVRICKYNLDNNNLEILCKADELSVNFFPDGQFIDHKNKILYNIENSGSFVAMDLQTNELTHMGSFECGYYAKIVNVQSTINKNIFHIVSDYCHHSTFDCNNKTFQKVDCDLSALEKDEIGCLKLIHKIQQSIINFRRR